jgi:purine nucleosidase
MNVDPLAASIVFGSGVNIVAIPLDITHQTTYDKSIRDRIRNIDDVLGPNLATMLDRCAATYPEFKDNDEAPLHDPHTIAYMLAPELYSMQTGNVIVHTDGEYMGKTEFIPNAEGNVQIPLSVNAAKFFDLVISNLGLCALKRDNAPQADNDLLLNNLALY